MSYKRWVEIDLSSIKHNIREIKRNLGEDTIFMVVLKANAYGFGLKELSNLVVENGADWIALSDQYEGRLLREFVGASIPILILSPPFTNESLEITIDNDLIQGIDSYEQAKKLNALAKSKNKVCKVHLKINTGLNRYGISIENVVEVARRILRLTNIELEGVYSHFSTQYSDLDHTKIQFSQFKKVKDLLIKNDINIGIFHCANSTMAIDFPEMQMDAVRIGFSLFNYSPGLQEKWELVDCIEYKTRINEVRIVHQGEYIGYDKKFKTSNFMKIGIIPVGYADGIPTALANKGYVLVQGVKVPIIGSVCMTQIFLGLSSLKKVKAGEEVIIIGTQGKETIRAKDIGDLCGAGEAETIMKIVNANDYIYYV